MTAVLSATNALQRDPIMASIDDNQPNYSVSDWKAKYNEVADMLAETRAELDEFHTSSKELEEELIKEIERTEKAQHDLKIKVARSETEKDEWKSKFVSLQTTHNTTTTSLQRELDTVRQECQKLKVQLRDLELGNDDLERNERAVTSSLVDVEAKYSRTLEEKILLEHELLDKANLEEELQRLKDELRDASVEISILKDQLVAAQSKAPSIVTATPTSSAPSSLSPLTTPPSTEENLLNTPPPPDLQLSELSCVDVNSIIPVSRPPSTSLSSTSGQSVLLQRAGFQPSKANPVNSTPSSITRSSTLPSLSASSRIPPRTPISRPNFSGNSPSSSSVTNIPATASRSKGVQMVSEMRARVRNLEQKIHTRVPRLRMGSNATRQNANALAASTMVAAPMSSSMLPSKNLVSRSNTIDPKLNKPSPQRHSADVKKTISTPAADTSGWVLIMDDTPSPSKDTDKERRRASSPSAPSAFRRGVPPSASSPTFAKASSFQQSTIGHNRRPQSRLSGASLSTTATGSSIPTPSSRPATPTFLPVPTSSLYSHTAGVTGLKRSTAPGVGIPRSKRSSVGSSNAGSPTPSEGEYHSHEGISPYNTKNDRQNDAKTSPHLPQLHTNVTIRGSSRLPSTSSMSVLSQSRIGRPAARKSGGLEPAAEQATGLLGLMGDKAGRGRSGSHSVTSGKNGF
ncbi:hypothetical protein BJ138DRAFT_1149443 [Hygrophoropsis aurantiaca]|uniref:Uncharacterized protein n=1 Tax=Hygrophoropsis aurantiaca TaxID=72124 RepID=A0ACB8AG87_9AGAM|nr:hypothetical protein BJ138DRAFT_1149443 [Hygrophoropsis aurantiaca]